MECSGNGCLPKVTWLSDPLLVGAQCVSDQADENDKDKTAARLPLDCSLIQFPQYQSSV